MIQISQSALESMERRLEKFDEWYMRVVGQGDGYDLQEAIEDWHAVSRDMKLLIELARARV